MPSPVHVFPGNHCWTSSPTPIEKLPRLPKRFCWLQISQTEFHHICEDTVLTGELHIDYQPQRNFPVKLTNRIKGIRISIEAKVVVNLGNIYLEADNVLDEFTWAQTYVIGGTGTIGVYSLPEKDTLFPFSLKFGSSLPPSSSEELMALGIGQQHVQYEIVASCLAREPGKSEDFYPLTKKKIVLKFGFCSLLMEPACNQTIFIEKVNPASEGCSALRTQVFLSKSGFLIGEQIPFNMNVISEHGNFPVAVRIALIQRIRCKSQRVAKEFQFPLDVLETKIERQNGSSDDWNFNAELTIPNGTPPTSSHKICQLQYLLKVKIYGENRIEVSGCEAVIAIGTSSGDTKFATNFTSDASSIHNSMTRLLPPSYSTLSSRHPSIETLPPDYSDYLQKLDTMNLNNGK